VLCVGRIGASLMRGVMRHRSVAGSHYLPSILGSVLASTLLGGCAAPIRYAAGEWAPIGYVGFSEAVDSVAGDGAIDCGFVNLLQDLGAAAQREAFRCVQRAVKRGDAFKYGTLDIPIDSFAYEVLARPKSGQFWLRTYDVMLPPDDAERAQWTKRCQSIRLKPRRMTYEGVNCTEVL
jgi:hypothetical protein